MLAVAVVAVALPALVLSSPSVSTACNKISVPHGTIVAEAYHVSDGALVLTFPNGSSTTVLPCRANSATPGLRSVRR